MDIKKKKIRVDKKEMGYEILNKKILQKIPGKVSFNVCDRGDGKYIVDHIVTENHF